MLLDNGARGTGGQRLPSLRLVVREAQRPALAIESLTQRPCHQQLRGSLTKLIQYSGHFQNQFRKHQLRLSGGATIKDLSYAAQRFDSTVRPLGRMVNHFDAFVQTAMDIMNERAPSKKEHQGASRALEVLNTETMLQLGMAADACEVVV